MAYVYILESEKSGRYYIGSSDNVEKRLSRHNAGLVEATRRYGSFKLKFKQKFRDEAEARQIEAKLKRLKRKDYIKKIIESQTIRFRATSSSGRALPF